ncbi:site-specific DNA-methyltransferase [Rodentibacter ratti]|uniref:site-specific DNA-methyltransferase (adenine-specific) n=1 Tax=Rodentibacter ratti TaxID=1906745 RepID=A0A1V3L825_9PAST|nr:site-specific DNA-methyltransferase [Rodentibacter ratti]OOF86005.1 site-specific DNA-methyltransferase [Rodentibacter ratti]
MTNQKLELTWIGKDKRPKLEARILLEDAAKSYHAPTRSERAIFDNRLIFGDNLLALKALEQEFAGKVKCVFIDPPYNTGSAFAHYDDGLEHSIWLGLMRDRLELIKRLLADDGSVWITIDDNEAHYLKVLCDEVFGRGNFVANIVWNHRKSVQSDIVISLSHNHILVFAKSKEKLQLNRLQLLDSEKYSNPDNDPRGLWYATPFDAPQIRPNLEYPIENPNTGEVYYPPQGRHWRTTQEEYLKALADNRIVFGKTGKSKPQMKRFLSEAQEKGSSVKTWWDEVGTATEATKELQKMSFDFDTPKPERLIERILQIATNPGDLVLDSFAGSGTTGAVAHKMGRRWIMVELGEHCHTHIIPRLQKVIDGTDQGGISKALNWQGGGGFRYFLLAPSLIVNDKWGNPIINPDYNPEMLAEAITKLEGFTYRPSETLWWQHGFSSERDFIYVTTQTLSAEQLQALSDEVGENQSLLVCCAAWRGITAARFPNLSLKKIPKMVLARCEWGHDDYSLNVANLPMAEPEPMPSEKTSATKTKSGKGKSAVENQKGFFEGDAGDV